MSGLPPSGTRPRSAREQRVTRLAGEIAAEEQARLAAIEQYEQRVLDRAAKEQAEKQRAQAAEETAAAATFAGQVALAKAKLGIEFGAPAVDGEGWATQAIREKGKHLAARAQQLFEQSVSASEAFRAAKLEVAGVTTSIMNSISNGDLSLRRDEAAVAETRFEVAYEELEAFRRNVEDAAFLADIEAANACEDGFTPWLADDLEEAAQIGAAITSYMEAIRSLVERQRAKTLRSSAAAEAARKVGISLPSEAQRTLPLYHGETWAQRRAQHALVEFMQKHREFAKSLPQPELWFPDFANRHRWVQ